jgi:predicted acetyltransferase
MRTIFTFFEPGDLVDRELELVAPDARYIDDVLRTCAHPLGREDQSSKTTRQHLTELLRTAPGGRFVRDTRDGGVPQYIFWMRLRREFHPPAPMAGTLGLRIGTSDDLRLYLGNVGYNVYPVSRGNHYAERAVRLVLPLAQRHGMRELWITCNPDNIASRKTCERLGAEMIDVVTVPSDHLLYQRGDREKCRYRLVL